ncbi:MAG: PucR family transcriptional regulator [Lachnospiraceae bacterium]
MIIPLSIFGCFIEKFLLEKNECAESSTIRPEYCYRYFPGIEIQEGELLMGYAEEIPEDTAGKALALIGRPSGEILQRNAVIYTVQKSERFFYEVQKAAGKLLELDSRVQEILLADNPFADLANSASAVFGNHVFIHDSGYILLAASGDPPGDEQWEYNEFQKCYVLSEDIISEFKCNQDYLDTMDTHEAAVFPADTFGYRILYRNLWENEQYKGRICVCELKRLLHPGDFWLIEWMTNVVKLIRKHPISTEGQRFHPVISMLEYLLNEGTVSRKQMDQILVNTGWTSRDRYYLVSLFPEQPDDLIRSENYQRQRLAELSSQFCILTHNGRFLLLINETVNELSISDFRYHFASSLRDQLMKVGISCVGQDLMQIRQLYRQACIAYQFGSYQDSTFWVYNFDDYRMEYMISQAKGEFDAELICRPELFWLQEYDKDHTSELLNTLRVFLKWERSIARACEELSIHRTTLLYRMQRIDQLTHLNLDDEETRLELILSYKFLEKEKFRY